MWLAGLLILVFFAAADRIGISRNPNLFGHHQLIGSTIGMALAVLGFALELSQGKS
jgi:hypothetical protein